MVEHHLREHIVTRILVMFLIGFLSAGRGVGDAGELIQAEHKMGKMLKTKNYSHQTFSFQPSIQLQFREWMFRGYIIS